MLYQTDFCFALCSGQDMQSALSVKTHGAAMKAIPSAYAAKMHTNDYHPFSIFTVRSEEGYTVRVSALCDEASAIPKALAEQPAIRIYTEQGICDLSVLMQNSAAPIPAAQAAALVPERGCRLIFSSPAMIRVHSRPTAKPDICTYFYSVIRKYNAFENGSLDYAAFQEAFSAAWFGAYQISSDFYQITGRTFPGMTGYCDLYFPQDAKQNRLLRLCLGYASYSGIGSKTTQGMGGILLEPLPPESVN